jgi:hypothetical protein
MKQTAALLFTEAPPLSPRVRWSPGELYIKGAKARNMLIIVGIIGCILGYGYWHSITHASIHIQLNIKDVTNGKPKTIPKAEIIFFWTQRDAC